MAAIPPNTTFEAEREKDRIYGWGNHEPNHWLYSPRCAYQQSQSISLAPANYDRWCEFFEKALVNGHDELRAMMTDRERAALAALPKIVTIYRGIRLPPGEELDTLRPGFSWTLERARAQWFATEYATRFVKRGSPVVLKGSIFRDAIIWLLLGRNEAEIVVRPGYLLRWDPCSE